MPIPKRTLVLAVIFLTAGSTEAVFAQQNSDLPVLAETTNGQVIRNKRLKRDVQPIPYWVDTTTLRLRDNPVAGKIVGNLDYGQKVMAYSQYENWVRVSKSENKAQWVNSDFLSNTRLSWASYNRNVPTRTSDVVAVRIKDPENRKKRIFAVRLKTADTSNAIITTRQNTAQGPLYQNRFVSCDEQRAIGVRIIGEGSNFLGAQNDVRNLSLDIYEPDQINDKANDSAENAISKFACKAQPF